MKKILITLCLVLSLLINIVPVYATQDEGLSYATGPDMAGYDYKVRLQVGKGQYEDPEFILNKEDFPVLEIYSYTNKKTYYYDYTQMLLSGNSGYYYYNYRNSGESFDFDTQGLENFCYDLYLLNPDGERVYHLYVKNAKTAVFYFDSFEPYVEEDTESTEGSESSESTSSESTESSGSSDSNISSKDISILHNDSSASKN